MIRFVMLSVFGTDNLRKISGQLLLKLLEAMSFCVLFFVINYFLNIRNVYPVAAILILIFIDDGIYAGVYNQVRVKVRAMLLVALLKFLSSAYFAFCVAAVVSLALSANLPLLDAILLLIFLSSEYFFSGTLRKTFLRNLFMVLLAALSITLIFIPSSVARIVMLFCSVLLLLVFFLRFRNLYYDNDELGIRRGPFFSEIKTAVQIYYLNVIFILRCKRQWFIASILVFCMTVAFFVFLSIFHPDVLLRTDIFQAQLFYALSTSSFLAVCGPYIPKWILFYRDDLASRNIPFRRIFKAEIYFFYSMTIVSFALYVPLIVILRLPLLRFVYYALCNMSLNVIAVLVVSLILAGASDADINPRLSKERGNLYSAFLPWVSVLISVVIYQRLSPHLSDAVLSLMAGGVVALSLPVGNFIIGEMERRIMLIRRIKK